MSLPLSVHVPLSIDDTSRDFAYQALQLSACNIEKLGVSLRTKLHVHVNVTMTEHTPGFIAHVTFPWLQCYLIPGLSKFDHCSHNKSVVLPYKELLFKFPVPHDSGHVCHQCVYYMYVAVPPSEWAS